MARQFDHERLDVYQLLLKFVAWATQLIKEVKERNDVNTAEERDHLNRAMLSSLFNTAEGNGKRRRQVRARFFDDARGSATECAACIDALVAKSACTRQRVAEGKDMLVRIVQMLTKLVHRFESNGVVSELEVAYGVGASDAAHEEQEKIEDEDEIEIEDD
jgi:four helix bundle protein